MKFWALISTEIVVAWSEVLERVIDIETMDLLKRNNFPTLKFQGNTKWTIIWQVSLFHWKDIMLTIIHTGSIHFPLLFLRYCVVALWQPTIQLQFNFRLISKFWKMKQKWKKKKEVTVMHTLINEIYSFCLYKNILRAV